MGSTTATRAVNSLVQQSLPKDAYEILLIGDADATNGPWAAVPNLHPVAGAAAEAGDPRNLAVRLSQAPSDCLSRCACGRRTGVAGELLPDLEDFGKAARAVGGRVRPLWEVPRPDWLGDELLPDLSLVDLGDEARFIAAGEHLAPVNMAYCKATLEALGGFHRAALRTPLSAVGPAPQPIDEITSSGGKAVYDPLTTVGCSTVPTDRLIPEWFRRNAAWRAVSDLLRLPPPTAAALGERWRAVKDFFFDCPPTERTIRGLVLRQDDPRRFQQQITAIYDSLFCLLSGIGKPDYD